MTETLGLLATPSDGSVEQWDGAKPAQGVMLRWFADDILDFPEYGYDVYRAPVGDAKPFRFDEAAVRALRGKRRVLVDDEIELLTSDPTGLEFAAGTVGGPAGLYCRPGETITINFVGRAWDLLLGCQAGAAANIEVLAGGVLREAVQIAPGSSFARRTRGIDQLVITGDALLGPLIYRLVEAPMQWTLLGHRSLPVSAAGYPDPQKPVPGAEATEARSRLPAGAMGRWAATYAAGFTELLPVLTALAQRQPAPVLPAPATADDPALQADTASLLRAALIDPHIARIVGVAYDDPISLATPSLVAYKVVGRWPGASHEGGYGRADLEPLGLSVAVTDGRIETRRRDLTVVLDPSGILSLRFGATLLDLEFDFDADAGVEWVAYDAADIELDRGRAGGGRRSGLRVGVRDLARLELTGPSRLAIAGFRWTTEFEDRYGIAPGVTLVDPGPPQGPAWVTVDVDAQSLGRRVEASLDWDTNRLDAGAVSDTTCVGVQIAHTFLDSDPTTPQPTAPTFDVKGILRDGAPIVVPPAVAVQASPRMLAVDGGQGTAGLAEGWHAWWARGVDLFGRCSMPTPAALVAVVDSPPPPPPLLVLAEYVQFDLPPMTVSLLGRSPLAAAWLDQHPTTDALAVCIAWTPEHAAACADVDAFDVNVRRPMKTTPIKSGDPDTTYDGVDWGKPVTSIGPVPTALTGVVMGSATTLEIEVTAVEALPPVDPTDPKEPMRYRVTTDLPLDTGSGAFIDARLVVGGDIYPIVGNGEGPAMALTVSYPKPQAPSIGGAEIQRKGAEFLVIETGMVAPAIRDPFQRAYAGVLATESQRFPVMALDAGRFICRSDGQAPPTAGTKVVWYPAWALTVADGGFGPIVPAGDGVGRAQVAAVAIRRSQTHPVRSPYSTPAGIVAVDTVVPDPPTLPVIASGPWCAEVATRADWYGISRFTFDVKPAAGEKLVTYRALGETLWLFDHDERVRLGAGYAVDTSPAWAQQILADSTNAAIVANDLATLTTALAAVGTDQLAMSAAYGALHADAQRIIAGQAWVRTGYTLRNSAPLGAADLPYVDELDGRSRAHWFYRAAARSAAGNESDWTAPTPPICCPDVTPPGTPVARLALATDDAVTLQWLALPEPDVERYLVYASQDREAISEIRDLTPIVEVAAKPAPALPPTGAVAPAAVAGHPGTLEHAITLEPGRWHLRLVAVDEAGNRSRPSNVVTGASLKPPPKPPIWGAPVRTGDTVALSWTHPDDQRLATVVERREPGGPIWVALGERLPRGQYTLTDIADPSLIWEYRLSVFDHLGQTAASQPTLTVAAAP